MVRSAMVAARRKPRPPKYKPALNAGTMADLLTGISSSLACSLIPEPRLLFCDKQACEDPKTGLTPFRPYSKTDVTRRSIIRIGVAGPAEAIDRALHLIERMGSRIPFHAKNEAMLNPSFPASNAQG